MKLNNQKIEIKWAAIFVVTTLLWLTLEKLLGFHDEKIAQHPIITNFFMIPAILVYLLALLDKRKKFYGGVMTYKQGFISGLIISIIVALCIPITQSIISYVITPDYYANAIAYSVESGGATQEEAEAYFNIKSYIIQGMLFTPVIGTVTTAILMIFVKKSK